MNRLRASHHLGVLGIRSIKSASAAAQFTRKFHFETIRVGSILPTGMERNAFPIALRNLWPLMALLLALWPVEPATAGQQLPPATQAFGAADAANWPMFRGGPNLLGVAPVALPASLRLLWTFKAGEGVKSSAAIVGGQVFVGSDDGNLYNINLADGKRKWAFKTDGAIESSRDVVNQISCSYNAAALSSPDVSPSNLKCAIPASSNR